MSVEIGSDRIPTEARDLLGRAENRPADRLIGKCGGVEKIENKIVGRIFDRADFLKDHAFFALQLRGVEYAIGEDVGENVERQRRVFGEHMGVVSGMFRAGRGVEIAARPSRFPRRLRAPSVAGCL